MKNLKRQGWIVLATATGINFLAGLLYIWSVIKTGLKNDLGWNDMQATLPYTVAIVAFVCTMVGIGKLQDIKGPRLTATLSGILMGSGLILSSLHTDPTLMIITFGVITGAGCGISNVSTVPPAVKWFSPTKKGMVTGVVVAGVALASVFYSPFTHTLIGTKENPSLGLSGTFLVMGIGILILTVFFAQFLKNPPIGFDAATSTIADAGHATAAIEAEKVKNFGADLNWMQLLKRLDFYKLWIMFAFASAAGLFVIGNVMQIAAGQSGMIKADIDKYSFLLVILLAIFNAIGRFLGGSLADKIHHYTLLSIIFAVAATNIALFSVYNNIVLVSIGIAVAGLCYGAGFAAFPTIMVSNYGVKNYGSNYGIIMTAWGVGSIIGPMVAAAIRDSSGTYTAAYFFCCALLVIALLIALATRFGKKENCCNYQMKTSITSCPLE